ncbi:hypothetical protein WMY93_016254 [Mugilogobius chulae]|uniref:Uncharacterized protein n=1 Tax=Mugilogobius chulae TaxID=88201 RepID=A0AAW0NUZ2_9GOBI
MKGFWSLDLHSYDQEKKLVLVAAEGLARGREQGGKDESSVQGRSLPPGTPLSDAWPHGLLTYCLCDLWRLEATADPLLSPARQAGRPLLYPPLLPETLHHPRRERRGRQHRWR